ncbi:MAG TPA: hypothetical protein PJ988_13075 [Anaerolinea sp.]|nr:hypothetical protein [Anaerolinea sp.]
MTVRLLAPTIGSNMIAHAAVSSANADPVMENNTTQLRTALKHVQYLPVVTIQP